MKKFFQALFVSSFISTLIAFAFAWKVYDAITTSYFQRGLPVDSSVSFFLYPIFYGPFLTHLTLMFVASLFSSIIVLYISHRQRNEHGIIHK